MNYSIRSKLKLLLPAVGMMFLAACATTRPPTEAAVSYALVEDSTLRKLAKTCERYGVQSRQAAWRAQKEWWKRNGEMVEAADYGLTNNLVDTTGERQETAALIALSLTYDVAAKADANVLNLLGDDSNRGDLCVELLEDYRDGDYDLQANSEHYKILAGLLERKDRMAKNIKLSRASVEKNTKRRYGRSFYAVEKLSKRQGCAAAKVKALKIDWPNEVYDATCADNSYLLVRCEWGNCSVQ